MTSFSTPAGDLNDTGLTRLTAFDYHGVRLPTRRWQQQFQHKRDYSIRAA